MVVSTRDPIGDQGARISLAAASGIHRLQISRGNNWLGAHQTMSGVRLRFGKANAPSLPQLVPEVEAWHPNLYGFAYNDPISDADPYGLSVWSWCKEHWDDFLEWVGVVAPKISDATDMAGAGLDAVRAARGIYEIVPDLRAHNRYIYNSDDPNVDPPDRY